MHPLVKEAEKAFLRKETLKFDVGDTVKVHTKIVEGDKERVQVYQGTVIGKRGAGMSETFTVARVSFGIANEKVFTVNSPFIEKVEVLRKGKVRRAKLNYIRGKRGKKARIAADVSALSAAKAPSAEKKAKEAEKPTEPVVEDTKEAPTEPPVAKEEKKETEE